MYGYVVGAEACPIETDVLGYISVAVGGHAGHCRFCKVGHMLLDTQHAAFSAIVMCGYQGGTGVCCSRRGPRHRRAGVVLWGGTSVGSVGADSDSDSIASHTCRL